MEPTTDLASSDSRCGERVVRFVHFDAGINLVLSRARLFQNPLSADHLRCRPARHDEEAISLDCGFVLKNAVFGNPDAVESRADRAHASDENVKLAATNDVIFYTMLSILKLQPYANPVSSVRICFAPSILMPKIQSILESISPTFHEQLCGF